MFLRFSSIFFLYTNDKTNSVREEQYSANSYWRKSIIRTSDTILMTVYRHFEKIRLSRACKSIIMYNTCGFWEYSTWSEKVRPTARTSYDHSVFVIPKILTISHCFSFDEYNHYNQYEFELYYNIITVVIL